MASQRIRGPAGVGYVDGLRHPYVPVDYPGLGGGPPVSAANPQQRAQWLAGPRLATNGYPPTLAAVDGAGGFPPLCAVFSGLLSVRSSDG